MEINEMKKKFAQELNEYVERFDKYDNEAVKEIQKMEETHKEKIEEFNEKWGEDIFPPDIPIRDEEEKGLAEEAEKIKEEKQKLEGNIKSSERELKSKVIEWKNKISERKDELTDNINKLAEEKAKLQKELDEQKKGIALWEKNGINKNDVLYQRRINVVIPNLEKQISELDEKMASKEIRDEYSKLGKLEKKLVSIQKHDRKHMIPELQEILEEEEQEKAESKPKAKTEPKSEPKSEPKTEPKSEPKSEPKTEPKPEPKSEPKPEPKSEPKSEPKTEPKPEPKTEPKPEPKFEPKPEPKSEPKTEPKPEPKFEPKPEPKSEPKPEPKSEPKQESELDKIDPEPLVWGGLGPIEKEFSAEERGGKLESNLMVTVPKVIIGRNIQIQYPNENLLEICSIKELFAEYKRNEGFNIDFGDELLECLSEKLKDYFLGDPNVLKEIVKTEKNEIPELDGILKFDMDDISKGAFWPWNRKKRDIVANFVDEIREDNSYVEVVGEYEPNPLKRFFRRKAKAKALPKKEKYEQLTDGSERTEKTDENEIEQTEQLSPSEEFRRSQVVPSEELGKNEPEQPLNEMNEQENTKAQDTEEVR